MTSFLCLTVHHVLIHKHTKYELKYLNKNYIIVLAAMFYPYHSMICSYVETSMRDLQGHSMISYYVETSMCDLQGHSMICSYVETSMCDLQGHFIICYLHCL